MRRPSTCRDCGAAIWFAKSSHGRWIPLDAAVQPIGVKGKEVFVMIETDKELIAVRPAKAHVANSHIESCRGKKKTEPNSEHG